MFYDKYVKLCNMKKKTPSAAAIEIGLSKPTVNRWKNGGGITDATAHRVAEYFGVSVDELIEEKETPTVPENDERSYDDAVLLDAFNKADETTKELIRRALGLK